MTQVPGGKICEKTWELEARPSDNVSCFSRSMPRHIMEKLRFGYCLFLTDKMMLTGKDHSVVDLHYVSLVKLEINFPEFPAYLLPC